MSDAEVRALTLDVPVAAVLTGLSPGSVYKLARGGRLGAIWLTPKRVKIPTHALEAVLGCRLTQADIEAAIEQVRATRGARGVRGDRKAPGGGPGGGKVSSSRDADAHRSPL